MRVGSVEGDLGDDVSVVGAVEDGEGGDVCLYADGVVLHEGDGLGSLHAAESEFLVEVEGDV